MPKKRKTFIVVDVSYLCWRAYHTTGQLSYKGKPTGTLFGFFQELVRLRDRFQSVNFVFCFDGPKKHCKRRTSYPGYKSSRDNPVEEDERQKLSDFHKQVRDLRKKYLPRLGYRNIAFAKGYEGDDHIARVCADYGKKHRMIIVSRDHDLYQCLAKRVVMYDPQNKTLFTMGCLQREYGLEPGKWVWVKAIAGCNSDDVRGVERVGEKTAVAYVNESMNRRTKTWDKISRAKDLVEQNLPVVHLPLRGTPEFEIRKDKPKRDEWAALMKELGFTSFDQYTPLVRSKKRGRTRKRFD